MFVILEWFRWLPPGLEFIILLAAAVTAIGVLHKFVFKPVLAYVKKVGASADTLLGYEEIKDHTTGRVLQERTPPLANRVHNLEQAQVQTAQALERIADVLDEMQQMDKRIMEVTERLEEHEHQALEWAEGHEQWIRGWTDEHNALHMVVDEKSVKPPTPKDPS